jgi:hypothetical protein
MVRGTTDKAFADQFDQHLSGRMIVRQLTVLRCTKGLSRQRLPRRLAALRARFPSFEASSDKDIRFGDLADYVIALGRGLRIIVTPEAAPPSPWKSKGKTAASCLPNRPSVHRPGKKEAVNS